MEFDEDIYAAAERQLSLLEEQLAAAEGGLFGLRNSVKLAEVEVSSLQDVTNDSEKQNTTFRKAANCQTSSKEEDTDLKAGYQVEEDIRNVLEQKFQPTELVVRTDAASGGSSKVDISIASEKFEGLSLRERHKLVQQSVRSIQNYGSRIHSLTISKYVSPAELKKPR